MTRKLKNIVSIAKGEKQAIAKEVYESSKRLISINDLRNDDTIVYTNDKKGTEVELDDVLIAWDGANAGTIGFGKIGLIGSTIARLRFNKPEKFDARFVGIFLRSKFSYLRRTATGATIPHISRPALESISIPEFDVVDQIRIATLLSRVEALIATRKKNLQQLTWSNRFVQPS